MRKKGLKIERNGEVIQDECPPLPRPPPPPTSTINFLVNNELINKCQITHRNTDSLTLLMLGNHTSNRV